MVFRVETARDIGRKGGIRDGFVKEQCFQFCRKDL